MNKVASGDQADIFRRLIRAQGPISIAQYMGESNARYYDTRDPLGSGGDFITAPEISQMFGELIGLWLADIWLRAGRPDPFHYVELGPGRGTLARDALRSMAQALRAAFGDDATMPQPQVHFIEGSAALRQIQWSAVPDVQHHHDLSSVPTDGAILLVANEFFDALPIRQLIATEQGWRERMVGLDGDSFVFVAGDKPMDSAVPAAWRDAPASTLVETSPASATYAAELAARLVSQGGAGLVIDYGALQTRPGSTFQAIHAHRKVDVFAHPGSADLTAHVDFETLGQVAAQNGAAVCGMMEQGAWLQAMGIDARTEALVQQASSVQAGSDEQAARILRQHHRLVAPDQMGSLFKVMGLRSPHWPQGAGFAHAE